MFTSLSGPEFRLFFIINNIQHGYKEHDTILTANVLFFSENKIKIASINFENMQKH
jgi:hypothetical protein